MYKNYSHNLFLVLLSHFVWLNQLKIALLDAEQPREGLHTFPILKVKFKTKLSTNVEWFLGGLVFEAHRLLYHSAEGSRTF